jgi:predicted HicB family RNase H-like nuclease
MARINVDLDDELHRKVKAAAALNGVTLKDFVVTTLKGAVEEVPHPGQPAQQAKGHRV